MRQTSLGVFLVTYYRYETKQRLSCEVNVNEIHKIFDRK